MESRRLDNKKPNPKETAPFLSSIFFIWTLPVFIKGNKRDLTEDDLYKPLSSHRSHVLGNKLEEAWLHQVKCGKKSLARALWSVFKFEICSYILFNYVFVFGLRFVQPILLLQILNYYIPGQTSMSETDAFFFVIAIIFVIFIVSISSHNYVMGLLQIGMKLRVSICSLIYRKTLRLSKFAMNSTSTGQIINILSNDVRIFEYMLLEFNFLFIAPSELIFNSLLLYFLLGKTALIGILFFIAFMPVHIYTGKLSANFRFRIAKRTDQRILLMNEIISGIQVIKMYAWEKPFAKLVELARKLEIKEIRGVAYVNAFLQSYDIYMSRTAQFISILSFVLTGHIPVAQYVFVLSSIYNATAKTIAVRFPDGISSLAEARISCKRIETFMNLNEIQERVQPPTPSDKSNTVLKLTNATAKWKNDNEEPTLSNVNLEVKSMEKVALIGSVGSGKSSLINVILKELPLSEGSVKISGSVSYAAQEPWLFKGTIRQNILFGTVMNDEKYREVVRVCALEKDFKTFPQGDLSIVGEKGVMLSGGQKARINLARTVYRDADLYLLDDPLSAVDTQVGKQLYKQCICGYLSKKTVILVTHQLQYLNTMDKVYAMENGEITKSGSYDELRTSNGGNKFFVRLFSTTSEHEAHGEKQRDDTEKHEKESNQISANNVDSRDVKEHISRGSMSSNVYKEYFKSGGNWYVYVPVLSMFLVTQLFATSADYFITFWVNLEQFREISPAVGNSTNSSTTPSETFLGVPYTYFLTVLSTETCVHIYIGIVVLLISVALSRTVAFFQYCLSASTTLHNNMFDKISKAPMRFFNTNPSGRILNRFSKDIGVIDESLPVILLDSIEISITVLAISTVLVSINLWMIIPTVAILLLFSIYKHFFIKTSRSVKRIEGTVRSPVFSHVTASLQGLSTIRSFKVRSLLTEEFDAHQDLHSSAYFLFLSCNRAFGMLLDMNCSVYIAIVTISNFFTASLGGNVGLSITQSMGLTGRMQWGVRQLSEAENQMTSVERVLEYSNLDSEQDTEKTPPKGWPSLGCIEFLNVSMKYGVQDEPAILKNLNFTISSGEKIGIVGRTGAGKTSIISALFHLANVEGKILIDGINTRDVSLKYLRSSISIIPQEPFLFTGTLRKNLDPFDEYNDGELWEALAKVELKSVIEESPLGLNFQVSEGGSNFSVGQRQLVCLARAIFRKNKILVLDEATANVDPETDELIQSTIKTNFGNCTVLTIAHRLHTIMGSDRVLVMDGGQMVEFGHPSELLKNPQGVFHGLVMETGKGMSESLTKQARQSYDDSEGS